MDHINPEMFSAFRLHNKAVKNNGSESHEKSQFYVKFYDKKGTLDNFRENITANYYESIKRLFNLSGLCMFATLSTSSQHKVVTQHELSRLASELPLSCVPLHRT